MEAPLSLDEGLFLILKLFRWTFFGMQKTAYGQYHRDRCMEQNVVG